MQLLGGEAKPRWVYGGASPGPHSHCVGDPRGGNPRARQVLHPTVAGLAAIAVGAGRRRVSHLVRRSVGDPATGAAWPQVRYAAVSAAAACVSRWNQGPYHRPPRSRPQL
jgi:hypothetical protein